MKTEAKFYLEKRKDKQTGQLIALNVPIFLYYSFQGQRIQFYTGFRVDAVHWDEAAMKVRRNCEQASDINRELSKLKSKVEDIHDRAKAINEELTLEEFRKRIKGDSAAGNKTKYDFHTCYSEYLTSSALTKTESTVIGLKTTQKVYMHFEAFTKYPLSFKTINQTFYDKFLEYCFNERGIKNTGTGNHIRNLKAFLNWATEKGYNTNLDFRKKGFKRLTENPEILFLTYEELMFLYKYDFSDDPILDLVRDTFCLSCFTGLRFSDVKALAPENIHNEKILYRVVKTTDLNTVPLNPYSKAIIEKYKGRKEGHCLPVIKYRKNAELLKVVFKVAKLNRPVQKIHFVGAKRFSTTAPLSDVITFHMGKKTFMTNFLAKGGSLLTAMSITGNKDFRTAKRYYKVVDSLKQEEMSRVFGGLTKSKPAKAVKRSKGKPKGKK